MLGQSHKLGLPGAIPGPASICPRSPIGMRRLSQKENRVGSNPTEGTIL